MGSFTRIAERLFLRQPRLAQAIINVLAPGEIGRIVGRCAVAETGNGESRIECEAGAGRGPRLLHPAEMRKGRSKTEMCERKIPVGFDGTTELQDSTLIAAHIEFGESRESYPDIGVRIARTEAERLVDVSLGFLSMTHNHLAETEPSCRNR